MTVGELLGIFIMCMAAIIGCLIATHHYPRRLKKKRNMADSKLAQANAQYLDLMHKASSGSLISMSEEDHKKLSVAATKTPNIIGVATDKGTFQIGQSQHHHINVHPSHHLGDFQQSVDPWKRQEELFKMVEGTRKLVAKQEETIERYEKNEERFLNLAEVIVGQLDVDVSNFDEMTVSAAPVYLSPKQVREVLDLFYDLKAQKMEEKLDKSVDDFESRKIEEVNQIKQLMDNHLISKEDQLRFLRELGVTGMVPVPKGPNYTSGAAQMPNQYGTWQSKKTLTFK